MTTNDLEWREQAAAQLHGTLALSVAYIGVVNGLFAALDDLDGAGPTVLAKTAGMDVGYVTRWCDAAYAFGLLDEADAARFTVTELGRAYRGNSLGTLMPFAVRAMLSTHMAERAAALMRSGERPGDGVLAERETVVPWFGPMLEHQFGGFFEREILPSLPAYREVDRRGGLAVDLGCGNGWYVRRLVARYPGLRGLGLDAMAENITQAAELAQAAGIADRLRFETGDIHDFQSLEPADLIAMNRALHHVWHDRENVFRIIHDHLKPGGYAVIWEPNWPVERSALRMPGRAGMAFQNLAEHVQGNHLLRPDEIAAQFRKVGMEPEIYLFADGGEAVITAVR
ncbi:MAG: methyltransferase type 11 [Chromatiales bacterium 21-64-14]|nr:MAG: methyltransferase type 11 [Chromatiales bacterium 21-64-14]HQU16484.1 class I SAM-dependent methyltransferase [Gammaproteobacteria bacterium]